MTTNKELLELVADIAGAHHNGYRFGENGREPLYGFPTETDEGIEYRNWNPLTDDGDALRLAVRLGILLRTDFIKHLAELMRKGMDHDKATRRAIVLAAAEIGKIINYQSDSN